MLKKMKKVLKDFEDNGRRSIREASQIMHSVIAGQITVPMGTIVNTCSLKHQRNGNSATDIFCSSVPSSPRSFFLAPKEDGTQRVLSHTEDRASATPPSFLRQTASQKASCSISGEV